MKNKVINVILLFIVLILSNCNKEETIYDRVKRLFKDHKADEALVMLDSAYDKDG